MTARLAVFCVGGLASMIAVVAVAAPWPGGRTPQSTMVTAQLRDAEARAALERAERFLDAGDPGESHEHATLFQDVIDADELPPAHLFVFGDAAFEHAFAPPYGLGRVDTALHQPVHDARGGLDAHACADCHHLGGPNGAGGATQNAFYAGDGDDLNSALVRNPPHVLGLGLIQAIAAQISQSLAYKRGVALDDAAASGQPVEVELTSHGLSFGTLVAYPDGRVDADGLEGIDADLVVKPFGWKGHTASLRRFAERAALLHMGLQSGPLVEAARAVPDPRLGSGTDWFDPDGDGVARELEEGTLTALAVYLALLETPVFVPPAELEGQLRWARGRSLFEETGCAGCHRPALALGNRRWTERADTTDGAVEIHLVRDSEGASIGGNGEVYLFSDLKRHDMGPELADPRDSPDGIPASHFLTRPLWGLADTAPYLHDGRAPTVRAAIEAHGGEAAAARAAFVALEPRAQRDLLLFLGSLGRSPRLRVVP